MVLPGPRSPQLPPSSSSSSPSVSQRQSFVENLRGMPNSPRASRQPSLSQQALQELLANPPIGKHAQNNVFAGRDWRSIRVGEVIDPDLVRFVDIDASVEEATNVLISSGSPNVVLIRENKDSHAAIGTFDYSDLNAYLLLVVGLALPDNPEASVNDLAQKGREGKPVPLRDVKDLGKKEPLTILPHTANLTKAVEIFGSGIHRIIIVKEHTQEVIGVLSQLRLVGFFWMNGRNFPAVDYLYPQTLRELNIGSQSIVSINGDRPVTEALEIMHNEGITSLPVVDNQMNVVGNISHVDVKLLTKTTALPLLGSSCIHFISVILSERGMNDGKDSFPVFHVTPQSTLAHTVAKLVATKSHRMWITTPPSPASSGPPTPAATPAQPAFSPPSGVLSPPSSSSSTPAIDIPSPAALDVHANPSATPPYSHGPHHAHHPHSSISTPSPLPMLSISAAALPGASLSGHLTGVISLTDVLNLFARASGLSPHDPNETRRARRRSSSVSVRSSLDGVREVRDIAGKR